MRFQLHNGMKEASIAGPPNRSYHLVHRVQLPVYCSHAPPPYFVSQQSTSFIFPSPFSPPSPLIDPSIPSIVISCLHPCPSLWSRRALYPQGKEGLAISRLRVPNGQWHESSDFLGQSRPPWPRPSLRISLRAAFNPGVPQHSSLHPTALSYLIWSCRCPQCQLLAGWACCSLPLLRSLPWHEDPLSTKRGRQSPFPAAGHAGPAGSSATRPGPRATSAHRAISPARATGSGCSGLWRRAIRPRARVGCRRAPGGAVAGARCRFLVSIITRHGIGRGGLYLRPNASL